MKWFRILACIAALLPAMQTVGSATAQTTAAPQPARPSRFAVEVAARGLSFPWALQFLPDGRLLVSERAGRLRVIEANGRLSPPVAGVPEVAETGQGGLLDVALDPRFAETGLVYFSYAEPRSGGGNGTSVARGRLVLADGAPRLDALAVIFRQQPATSGGLHFGSRLVFADDGTLFVTLGERYQRDYAQDTSRHWGKVVRINPDGSRPGDNPDFGPGARPELWSIGHRNPQSAALHPTSRKLWVVEHGPRGGDEVNVVEKGRNYGWPVIGYGIDYSGARLHAGTHRDGMEQPIYYWVPSIAPSGMAFYTGERFPEWKGSLFVGALAGQHLARLVLDGERIVAEERLLVDREARIRDVRQGPDGFVYVLTDSARAEIWRLVPKP